MRALRRRDTGGAHARGTPQGVASGREGSTRSHGSRRRTESAPVRENRVSRARPEGAIPLLATSAGPSLGEVGKETVRSIEPDLEQTITIACVQPAAAPIEITHQVIGTAIGLPLRAFGFEDEDSAAECADAAGCTRAGRYAGGSNVTCARGTPSALDEMEAAVAGTPVEQRAADGADTFSNRRVRKEASTGADENRPRCRVAVENGVVSLQAKIAWEKRTSSMPPRRGGTTASHLNEHSRAPVGEGRTRRRDDVRMGGPAPPARQHHRVR